MKELPLAFLIYATQTVPRSQLDEVMAEVIAKAMESEEDFEEALKLSKIIGMDLQVLAKATVIRFGERAAEFKDLVERELKQGEQWDKFVKRFVRLYKRS
ncbi:hypothetical protein [Ignicoccus hospitalis]|uniref:Uncharacterized protein n=1 Tax=Ignicoccus hospitalis (strain KIN4/I / DSM 18386 / JCM 14125) TaxID=453591 RepID=A8ABD9_IGNH4|nr:hypothetical protein [Ignicoccus hospitalis]ABU82241.1 hypothetical protein Igni_1063 [Ignicoccus hospitalis KIN4/I]HIH90179.1 hypothetical protein [Desulfurococcaceae archaeon]